MKKSILCLFLFFPSLLFAQFGAKAGLNFAKVSKASDINSDRMTGFHIGLFLAPPSRGLVSSRTELLFSRQGYDYKSGTTTGNVDLDYIQVGQMASLNFTKYLSVLFGAQTAYLVSATVDSSAGTNGSNPYADLMSLYNRIDYGYAIGAEVHPIGGLIVGARYNVSLGKLYKDIQSGRYPSFSSQDAKNNVIQLSVGWRFGTMMWKKK